MHTLILDADIVAYQAAAALEVATEWEEGYWTWHVNEAEVRDRVEGYLLKVREELGSGPLRLCLTEDSSDANFRRGVLPSYKSHRVKTKKPLVLQSVKQWMEDELKAIRIPSLEGDDVMGILATHPKTTNPIVISLDKDLKTIPAPYVRTRAQFTKDGLELHSDWGISEISEEEADYNWLTQTLTGDITDGYKGCPQVGAKKAADVLELGATIADNWQAVVDTFASKKLGPEEALVQARCARILRATDYDFKKKEVKLWEPPSQQ